MAMDFFQWTVYY